MYARCAHTIESNQALAYCGKERYMDTIESLNKFMLAFYKMLTRNWRSYIMERV